MPMPASSFTPEAVVEAVAYSPSALRDLLAKYSLSTPSLVNSKTHLTYFDEYFGELKAKTILVECPYTDGDFLDDYAAYYVRCLDKYRSPCVRLHFFQVAFDDNELQKIAKLISRRLNEGALQKAYLGFIVVKPLPETLVGRTCLKTYPEGSGVTTQQRANTTYTCSASNSGLGPWPSRSRTRSRPHVRRARFGRCSREQACSFSTQ